MEDDIKNYLQTVMFRGTPCNSQQFIVLNNFRKSSVRPLRIEIDSEENGNPYCESGM